MTPDRSDTRLKWLLRLVGGVELLAVPFVVAPLGWMDAVHDRALGLGPLPRDPVVEYMARGMSAVYAVHGAVLVRLAADVPRYRDLIRFVGGLHVLLGAAVFGADLSAGLPWAWAVTEGALAAGGGAAVWWLARSR